MYQGDNPKALLSITLLLEGFGQLFEKFPYEKITIKDICNAAGVSRQTFYNVFETKDELLKWRIHIMFTELFTNHSEIMEVNAETSIKLFVEVFYDHLSFMNLLIKNHMEMLFINAFMDAITDLTKKVDYNYRVTNISYHLAFYSGGLSHILFYWMKDTERISEGELINLLTKEIKLPYFV